MKRIGAIIAGIALVMLSLPFQSYAETPGRAEGTTKPRQMDMTGGDQGSTPSHYDIVPVRRGEIKDVEGSALKGDKVTKQKGKMIGTLEKLLMDRKTGKIEYGVVSLAKDRQLVPLAWSNFKINRESGQVVVNATKEQLEPALSAQDTQDRSPDLKYYITKIEKMRSEGKTQMPGPGIQKQPAAGGGSGEDTAATGAASGPRADPPGKAPGFEGGK